jgi:hypothetical protein
LKVKLSYGRAGKSARLFRSAKQGLCLVDAFLLLKIRITVGNDAGAGLHVHLAVLYQRRPQYDAGIHFARCRKVTDAAGVEAALFLFKFVDDLHRAHLRRSGHRSGGKAGYQGIERVPIAREFALDIRYDVHHVAVAFDEKLIRDIDGTNGGNAADIVAAEIEKHQVLGALLGVGK